MARALIVLVFICCLSGCWQKSKPPQLSDSLQFIEYWYRSKAEINVYDLDQARYGNFYKGQLVNIYVTEPFRLDKQVKKEKGTVNNFVNNVLKLNSIRRFSTGVYDYSAMTSVFVPTASNNFGNALKVSCSVQDWCGQTYSQLNFGQNGYNYLGRSYFENEVEENYHVNKAMTEDELLVSLRLMPDRIKSGSQMLIPSLLSVRFRHQKLKPLLAVISQTNYTESKFKGQQLKVLEVAYKNDDRNIRMVYENIFPFKVVGIEETYKQKDVMMTSYATLRKTTREPYWTQNAPSDSAKRKEIFE
jgi:hypothetical protein